MERFLVTGACGFQGSHVVEHLVRRGEEVVAFDLPGSDTTLVDRLGVPFVPGDLLRPDTLEEAFAAGPYRGVFHFAELASFSAPAHYLDEINVTGTAHLIEAMKANRTRRLVALSSGGVYGRPPRIPADESLPLAPRTRYDQSKLEMERLVQTEQETGGLQATIVRPAAVYGPRSRKGASVPLFLMALGQLPAVPGRGNVYAAFAHVRDVAGAARHLMGLQQAVGETYNVADDTLMTLEDILFVLAPHVDARIAPVHLPMWGLRLLSWWSMRRSRRTGRPPRIERDSLEFLGYDTFMSNRKLKETGYQFEYPEFVVGMVETIEWYKANNWLWRDERFGRRIDLLGAP